MKATIWHNPACGTSKTVLEILQSQPGIDLEVIEYLQVPPSREQLISLYRSAGITPREGLRTKPDPAETLVREMGLDDASDEAILDAMMAQPVLINRPLVETDKGVRLCRPAEVVNEIL